MLASMHPVWPTRVIVLALVALPAACRGGSDPVPSPSPSPTPSREVEATPLAGAPPPVAATSACDVPALREESTRIDERWASWSPRSGAPPDLTLDAIAAVWIHCQLPDAARQLLDLLIDHRVVPLLEARLPDHTRHHPTGGAVDEAAHAWLGAICPSYTEVATAVAEARFGEREAIWWDRCVHRFDFVTREQYVANTRGPSTMGFALHHWLTEAGVDRAIADSLARPVVLGGPWPVPLHDGLLLPAAEVPTKLDDLGFVVEVRPGVIHFDHRTVATIDAEGRIEPEPEPDAEARGALVGELYERLAGRIEWSTMQAEHSGQRWSGLVLLVVHRELRWSTLRPVINTAAAARAERVALVGMADDIIDPLRMVVVHDDAADGAPLDLHDATTVQGLVDAVIAHRGPARLVPRADRSSP
jgi:hypothetical protein